MNTYDLELLARDRQRELLADARPFGRGLVDWLAARLRGGR